MKFMMLIKSDQYTESGAMPSEKLIAAMDKYNDELVKAGVLLAAEGLQPSSRGAKIRYETGKRTVVEPDAANVRGLIGDDMPHEGPGEIELRQVFELE